MTNQISNGVDPTIFRAYDIRGIYPEKINAVIAYKIAQAYAKFVNPKKVILGRDVRNSGPELFEAAKKGLIDHGVNVVDIGVISTDMMYFAVANYGYDGGLTITASHNPREYNGCKMVRKDSVPISGDSGIMDLKNLVLENYEYKAEVSGTVETKDVLADYFAKCLSVVEKDKIRTLKVVANAMFGPVVQNLQKMNLPLEIIPLNEIPDGSFPKGAPDPLLPQNREETIEKIKEVRPDLGAAWDADADRFFLFDETGRFIPGYFLTAFLGRWFAQKYPGAKVIYDLRSTWAIIDSVRGVAGKPMANKAGHSFFKERMRAEDAVFAGENSGHFYFKDFYYADNGLIPFLLILQILSDSGKKLSELFDPYFNKYFISGEINVPLSTPSLVPQILDIIEDEYQMAKVDHIDGLSLELEDWRANIRMAANEPLLRLNIEAKDPEILKQKSEELLKLIKK